jgi:hypothetical protein
VLDQSGKEQESMTLQLCGETVRGAVVETVAAPQKTAIVAADLQRIRPVLDLPPILPPAEPPPTYRLSSAEVVAVERAVRVAGKFRKVLRASTKRHRSGNPTVSLVQNLLMRASVAAAETYGIRAAQEWADGFVFSADAQSRDAALFQQVGFDFVQLCSAKRALRAADRLSEERVRRLLSLADFGEDFRRLIRIARGIRIMIPPGFVPCSTPPPLRRKYKVEVPNAVNKLLNKQWEAGTVIILPTDLVRQHIPGVHFSFQHWTTKAGKACGRSLCDVANASGDAIPLNGLGTDGKQWLRDKLEKLWGKIVHPTVKSLALMVVRAVARFGLGNVILWKMDLAGAFNLMNFCHSAARLLAFELTGGLSVIHTTGMFGWPVHRMSSSASRVCCAN